VQYNEDDCRATFHIKDWLVGFLQEELCSDQGLIQTNWIQAKQIAP